MALRAWKETLIKTDNLSENTSVKSIASAYHHTPYVAHISSEVQHLLCNGYDFVIVVPRCDMSLYTLLS